MFEDNDDDNKLARLIDVYQWLKNLAYLLSNSQESISVKADDVRKLSEHTKEGIFLLKKTQQNITELSQQITELRQEIQANSLVDSLLQNKYQQQAVELERSVAEITQLEESRGIILAELASLKTDLSTHYQSDRAKHFVIIDRYKTLKEQHIDPLVADLFHGVLEIEPELARSRREVIHNIKGAFSRTVLSIGQQSGTKDVNQRAEEVFEHFLELLPTSSFLDNLFKDRIRNTIYSVLEFLDDAINCQPPALFIFYQNEDFSAEKHEPAKGYESYGTVITTIYPAYLVNQEVKVKALVLTDSQAIEHY